MPPKKLNRRSKKSKKNGSVGSMNESIVSRPLARNVVTRNGQPRVGGGSAGDARITVKHSERILSITGSTAFAVASLALNPGLALTFPWLRNLALDYEFYQFKQLRFRYVPRANQTIDGNVTMAVDFDAADAAPGSDDAISAYHGSVSSPPREPFTLTCSPADMRGLLLQHKIRYGPLPANLDITTYDVGNLWISTNAFAAATLAGYLWVDYVVDLITPQLPTGDDLAESYYIAGTSAVRTTPFVSHSSEAGSAAEIYDDDELLMEISGDVLITWDLTGTVVVDTAPTVSMSSGTAATAGSAANAAATNQVGYKIFRDVQKGSLLHVDLTPACDTTSAFILMITRLNYQL